MVTLIAVLLVASKNLREQYYSWKLHRFVESRDGCLVLEFLRDAQDKGLPADWADDILETAAKHGDCHTLGWFRYTTNFDRKLAGGHTPLMLAAANGQFNAVKFLLVEQSVNTRIRNSNGATAFDIAVRANHPEVAALISAAEQETWDYVLDTDSLIFELLSEGACSRDSVEQLLYTEKYASLAALRSDVQLVGDETGWFRVNDHLRIGAFISNVEFIWEIDGMRIDGVQYFYPPSYFSK